jgi:hypothetical protein
LPKKGDAALNDLGRGVTAATATNGEIDWARVPIASPKGPRPSASPSASAGNDLIGPWRSQDGRESISFAKDGAFRAHFIEQGPSPSPADVSGTYLVDGPTIALTVKGRPPMTWRFKIDGKDAAFTYDQGGSVKEDGATAKFSRASWRARRAPSRPAAGDTAYAA